MRTVKLREISELKTGPFGTQFSAREYVLEGTPVINVKNIGYGDIITVGLDYVGISTVERLADHKLREGDIVFGRKGSVDRHCLITKGQDGWMQGSDCIRVRFTDSSVLPDFVSYYLLTDAVKTKINNSAVGSTMASLNTDILGDIEINLPSYEEQSKIATTLSAIDRKIRNNNSINDYLEQQMMTIFRFNFLQNVQSDWQRLSLAILSEMYQPKTISSKELVENGKYYVYGANGIIGKYNQYNHPDAEIAVACRGASCGSIQMTLPFSWITGNAMVIKPTSDFPYKEYLYYYLLAKSPDYLCSGSAQPQLTRENLSLYTITVPSKQQTDDFEEKAKRSRILIINNQLENNRLISLRNWLLPMLMNGQATIQD